MGSNDAEATTLSSKQDQQQQQEERRSSETSNNGQQVQQSQHKGAAHKDQKHHDAEPNPFERSFSSKTATGSDGGKQVLPGVANLTSPSLNMQGMNQAPGGWSSFGSLRNGPLSPAMLLGPSGLGGFDGTLRTGLTPNESGIRTGLTPRGEGMYNLNSPGAAALFGNNFSTGLTPGGNMSFLSGSGGTNLNEAMFTRPVLPPSQLGLPENNTNQSSSMTMHGQDADAAANGLYLLAQHSQQQQSSHNGSNELRRKAAGNHAKHNSDTIPNTYGGSPPSSLRRDRRKSSFTDIGSPEETKPSKRGKKASSPGVSDSGNESDDGLDDKLGGRKGETDEEKRKNFLERNRQAALKCRQRKKQWLQNLQAKVEFYGHENDQLTSQVTGLREEIVNLKTMLLAHKDCPVARSNSIGGMGDIQQLQGVQY